MDAQARRWAPARIPVAGLLLATSLLLLPAVACVGPRGADIVRTPELVWPERDPRIRLLEVVDLRNQAQRSTGKILGWLGEEAAGPSFRRPYAVAWEGDDLIVADPDTSRVARIGRSGRVEFSPADLFVQPIGLAACWEGIVVSDSQTGGVALLGQGLRLVRWVVEGLSRPTGLACGGEELYVTETGKHRILAIRPNGERRSLGGHGNGPGQFNFPTSIASDGRTLVIGDTMNFRVQRLGLPSGEFIASFGELGDAPGEMPRMKGIALDRAGHLWVSDAYLDHVALYDSTGDLLISIGGHGTGPGQFSFPAGVAAHPDGRVAVVDSFNRRVKVFRILVDGTAGGA